MKRTQVPKFAIRFYSSAILFLFVTTSAMAGNRMLIDELKKLKDTLPVNDAQRSELSLRIADLTSSECLVSVSSSDASRRLKDCQDAYLLYRSALSATNSSRQAKIKFQMARLLLEQGRTDEAKPLLSEVLGVATAVELKREANFRLAEIEENDPRTLGAAEGRYRMALELCGGTDSCSFARYRIAWLKKKQGDLPGAIQEMKLGIYDAKGQPREESIRDLIMFMGLDSADPTANISFVEGVSEKLRQPKLFEDLAYSYLTAGNKASGVRVLEVVESRSPLILREVRLIEEFYGLRDWEKFQAMLTKLEGNAKNLALVSALSEPAEVEKICRRLAVQLDGERTTKPERAEEFKRVSLVSLDLFPKAKDASKIMEGWVAAEKDTDRQLVFLQLWTTSDRFVLSSEEKIQLRELRAGIAQKEKRPDAFIAEMEILSSLKTAKEREYRYALARAYWGQKDFAHALPLFIQLSDDGRKLPRPDAYAIQSQHLALDILNQKKELGQLQVQAKLWTGDPKLQQIAKLDPSFAKELQEMSEVSSQAEFEATVALGSTDPALKGFLAFCQAGRFAPKSCENAKTLAIKLNRHPELITILKQTQAGGEELASELEAGGEFTSAAKIFEAQFEKSPSLSNQIRLAMLYELGGDLAGRDRILNALPGKIAKFKLQASELEAQAVAALLRDAKLMNATWLKLSFGAPFKVRVAESIEAQGKGNAETRTVILAEPVSTGPAWDKYVWEGASNLQQKQSAIHFYKKNSERMFQARVAALKSLSQYIDHWVSGSGAELRVRLLNMGMEAHTKLAEEIVASPIPPQLNEDQANQIRTGLSEMAAPFQTRAEVLAKLIQEETAKGSVKTAAANADASSPSAASAIKSDTILTTASGIEPTSLQDLQKNPKDTTALIKLRDSYRAKKQERLAMYFEGRLLQLKQEGAQ